MKRSTLVVVVLAIVVFPLGLLSAGEDAPWMDMKNCSMCKNLYEQEGLMDHMTWEHHKISSGMMSITTVAPEYREKYQHAMQGMQETGKRLMSGEKMELCHFCQTMGALMQSGARMENVHTNVGDVMLITSSDPKVVEKIHEHAQKTIEFMEMAHGEHEGHEGHEGHSH